MKKIIVLLLVVLVAAGAAGAATNVPGGLTGFWQFATDATKLKATVGTDLVSVDEASTWYMGPWTTIGTEANPNLLTDRGVVQEQSWGYLQANPGLHGNGGGVGWNPDTWEVDPAGIYFANEYTVAIDYMQTQAGWNSLFQTSWGGNDNDGDLWIAPDGTIGVGDVGYSSLTFDSSQWHRIMLSVDNGSFFRVYVDGVLYLDGAGQEIDGRFSLYTDRVNFFADDSWEDMWGLVGNVAVWDHALTNDEVAGMGGTSTPLVFTPEPATLSLLLIGGLALLRRNRK